MTSSGLPVKVRAKHQTEGEPEHLTERLATTACDHLRRHRRERNFLMVSFKGAPCGGCNQDGLRRERRLHEELLRGRELPCPAERVGLLLAASVSTRVGRTSPLGAADVPGVRVPGSRPGLPPSRRRLGRCGGSIVTTLQQIGNYDTTLATTRPTMASSARRTWPAQVARLRAIHPRAVHRQAAERVAETSLSRRAGPEHRHRSERLVRGGRRASARNAGAFSLAGSSMTRSPRDRIGSTTPHWTYIPGYPCHLAFGVRDGSTSSTAALVRDTSSCSISRTTREVGPEPREISTSSQPTATDEVPPPLVLPDGVILSFLVEERPAGTAAPRTSGTAR